jgi:hypothetical protein
VRQIGPVGVWVPKLNQVPGDPGCCICRVTALPQSLIARRRHLSADNPVTLLTPKPKGIHPKFGDLSRSPRFLFHNEFTTEFLRDD